MNEIMRKSENSITESEENDDTVVVHRNFSSVDERAKMSLFG